MKKILFLFFLAIFFISPTNVFADDSAGFNFPHLTTGINTFTFTFTNLNSTPVGVVGINTSGILWSDISSSACTSFHLYNSTNNLSHNPAVEGCNVLQNQTISITATSENLISQPNDLSYIDASYDTDSGFLTGNYNLVGESSGDIIFDAPSTVEIAATPSSLTRTVGIPFNVDVKVTDEGEAFNAARAHVAVSSNLEVTNVFPATSNVCDLHYTNTPTKDDPSFSGAVFGGSKTDCTVYRMVLKPTSAGTGTITFTNGSIKAYSDNSEILTGVQNAIFTINAAGDTPTPTTGLSQLTITSPLQTYLTSFNLAGTKDSSITQVFVNDSNEDTTYPTGTTWSVPVTLNLGINNYTIYGRDAEANQTGTITTTVDRHTLGDINGDGEVDLLDASLFAVDWDKNENLSYILSDMNADGNVDLTDLSILAKFE